MFDVVFSFFLEALEFLKWYIPLYILFSFLGSLIAEAKEGRR